MSRTTTPAPARTDDATAVTTVAVAAAPDREEALERRLDEASRVDLSFVRRRGAILAAGSLVWASATFTVGSMPETSLGWAIQDLGGLVFQLGLMALLGVQARTMATGTGRVARAMIPVERVVLGLAMVWSFIHGAIPPLRDAGWLALLDICWPLSMLGMFVIGVKIAIAGRWRGAARVWPVLAESWAVVTVPTFLIAGETLGNLVGGTHLILGYAGLGLLLVLRPALVRPRR
jgi:hypothetical protein